MKKWKCSLCGFVYDPESENPPGELAGASICKHVDEDGELVDSYQCPQCRATKQSFKKV